MIVRVYRNKEKGTILYHSDSRLLDKIKFYGYEFVIEADGENWNECIKKINEQLNYNCPITFDR